MIGIIGIIFWIIGFVAIIAAKGSRTEDANPSTFLFGLLVLTLSSYGFGAGHDESSPDQHLYQVESNLMDKGNTVYVVMSSVNPVSAQNDKIEQLGPGSNYEIRFYSRPKSDIDPTIKKGDLVIYANGIIKKVNLT